MARKAKAHYSEDEDSRLQGIVTRCFVERCRTASRETGLTTENPEAMPADVLNWPRSLLTVFFLFNCQHLPKEVVFLGGEQMSQEVAR